MEVCNERDPEVFTADKNGVATLPGPSTASTPAGSLTITMNWDTADIFTAAKTQSVVATQPQTSRYFYITTVLNHSPLSYHVKYFLTYMYHAYTLHTLYRYIQILI